MVLMAGLADDQFDTKDFVLFQKTCHPTSDDIALGHDQIHTTVGNQKSAYGGIESIELFYDYLKLKFRSETAKSMQIHPELMVKFDPKLKSIAEISESLKEIAGNFYVDRR